MGETMTENAKITILGCGGSGGTPLATNHWGKCDPTEPKNRRTRSSIAIRTARTCVVVDTGPDFHAQMYREKIDRVDAILYTHDHSDHVNGIDDLRYAAIKRRVLGEDGYMLPLYGSQKTFDELNTRFAYMFKVSDDGLYYPLVTTNVINADDTITIGDVPITAFEQIHGQGTSFGFRIGKDVTYSTDVSHFNEAVLHTLKGTKTWIVDCGQFDADDEHLTVHPNIGRVLQWNKIVGADKIYLTHLTPRHDYTTLNNETPDYIECAYDGLEIKTQFSFIE